MFLSRSLAERGVDVYDWGWSRGWCISVKFKGEADRKRSWSAVGWSAVGLSAESLSAYENEMVTFRKGMEEASELIHVISGL